MTIQVPPPYTQKPCGVYKALLRLVLIYGSKAWTINTDDEEHLWIFERKILRYILKGSW
jgi:hypothetical protein